MKNTAFFMDFELETESSVFFPRPETELLIEKALELLNREKPRNILDVGTGSGNIAISLTKHPSSSTIVASDISHAALRVAGQNAKKYNVAGRIKFTRSDIFEDLPVHYRNFFDMIISNPPYVSLGDFYLLSGEVKNDPYSALYGGKDGLEFFRRITSGAGLFLKRDGILLMEIGYDQARPVKEMLAVSSFHNIEIYKDYSGIDRIIKAERWKSW